MLPYSTFFVPPGGPLEWRSWVSRMVDSLNSMLAGKLNATGEIRLGATADTTTIIDARIGAASVILFMPLSADAAAEVAAGGMYVASQTSGQATIAHANTPSTDRVLRFLVIA